MRLQLLHLEHFVLVLQAVVNQGLLLLLLLHPVPDFGLALALHLLLQLPLVLQFEHVLELPLLLLALQGLHALLVGDQHPGRHLRVHPNKYNYSSTYINHAGCSQFAELAVRDLDYFLLELLLARLLVVDAAVVVLGQPVRVAVDVPALALYAQQPQLLAAAETLRFVLLGSFGQLLGVGLLCLLFCALLCLLYCFISISFVLQAE